MRSLLLGVSCLAGACQQIGFFEESIDTDAGEDASMDASPTDAAVDAPIDADISDADSGPSCVPTGATDPCNGLNDDCVGGVDDGCECADGWVLEHPEPTNATINDVWWMSSSPIAYAVGRGGTILRIEGDEVTVMESPTDEDLLAVWGLNAGDVYAVGNGGTILHFNSVSWELETSTTTNDLYAVWITNQTGPNEGYAVGENGIVLRLVSGAWSVFATVGGGTSHLLSGWGTSINNFYVGTNDGRILYYSGAGSWDSHSLPAEMPDNAYVHDIWGTSASNVFAVGGGSADGPFVINSVTGIAWVWSETGITTPYLSFRSIHGGSASDIVIAGDQSTVLRYIDPAVPPAIEWSDLSLGSITEGFFGIAQQTTGDAIVVGESGQIVSFEDDGDIFTSLRSGSAETVWDVSGNAYDDLFAVGGEGTRFEYDGSEWEEITDTLSDSLLAIAGDNEEGATAVGVDGRIYQRNAAGAWSQTDVSSLSVDDVAFFDVWQDPASDQRFAVGSEGTILWFNGTSWSKETVVETDTFRGIWGSSPSDMFAVGFSGMIYRRMGAAWSEMTSPVSSTLFAVWGTSASDVWAVGDGGVVLRYSGSGNWAQVTSGVSSQLYGIWGSSEDNVFAAGSGTLIHYNGSGWSEVSGPSDTFNSVWGSAATNVFLVGDSGGIWHRCGSGWP